MVESDLYLAGFVPQRDSGKLCCARGTKFIITRTVFRQIVLCFKIPEVSH